MKRSIVALLLAAAVAASGCGTMISKGSSTAPARAVSPVLDRILAQGTLRVGTSGDQPPLSATTKAGDVIGLEADLAEAMAEAMDVRLQIVRMPFKDLLPALESGKVDVVMSGMTMTPKRNMRVAFVGPYFVSGKALLTKSKRMAAVKESSELNNPDTTLAALEGSTSQMFIEKGIPRAKLILVKDENQGVDMVIDGKADALLADFHVCVVSVLRHPKENLSTLVAPLTFEPLGAALAADDPLLVNWMRNFLLMLEGTGAMEELRTHWFKEGNWLSRLR
jgi:polar amino acid transport system substrate-binding protein